MSNNFGHVLKHCRALAGRTQLELALDAGVSPRHLSFIESGRSEPGRDVVARLADALDVPETARNALFAAAGFSRSAIFATRPQDRLPLLQRMLENWDPHPSALTDAQGRVLATNASMRTLHARLSGTVIALQGLTAFELALGAKGFGPYLKNLDELERRFAQCRTLEGAIAGDNVGGPDRQPVGPAVSKMLFAGPLGALRFELVETMEGHPLHGVERSNRIYSMVPSDSETEAAMSAMMKRSQARPARADA